MDILYWCVLGYFKFHRAFSAFDRQCQWNLSSTEAYPTLQVYSKLHFFATFDSCIACFLTGRCVKTNLSKWLDELCEENVIEKKWKHLREKSDGAAMGERERPPSNNWLDGRSQLPLYHSLLLVARHKSASFASRAIRLNSALIIIQLLDHVHTDI